MSPGRCCMIHEAQAPVLGRLLEDPRCSGHNGRLCAASLQCSRRDRGPPTDTSHYPFKTKQLCRSFLALFIHALSLFLSLAPLCSHSNCVVLCTITFELTALVYSLCQQNGRF